MERGRHVAHFEILNELGAGGMGIVYRARDLVLHRHVALKLIQPDRQNPDFQRRFLDEARIAATLAHPTIAAIHEAGEAAAETGGTSQMFVAQELVEGETLSSLLTRGPLPVSQAVDLTRQLLDGLAHAHARGIIHRDIKPSNLMLTPAGRLKVLDFGIAKRLPLPTDTTTLLRRDSPHQTQASVTADSAGGHTVIGTPSYMAPEQLRGSADPRTDIFATGCVLYELLTARRLLQAPGFGEMGLPGSSPSAAIRALRPDIPPELADVIDRALQFDPDARFQDASAFSAALDDAWTTAARTTAGTAPARARAFSRFLIPAAVIVGIVAIGFIAWRWSQPAFAFAERDLVLIASLVNDTGDPVFDRALEGALETDLRQSRYVNVFDDASVANALKMMRLEPSHRIDLETGQALCAMAGIRALLIPSIVSIGSAYRLDAALIDPASGRTVDRLSVTSNGREEVLLNGIDALTRVVRERLGESLQSIQKTDPRYAEFATPSIEAQQFLKIGGEALAASDVPRAARAFEQALQHDPKYPAALVSLGLLYIEFLNRPEDGRRMLAQALENSSKVSEREHFMLQAVHKQFVTNDPAGALEDYRFVSSLHPDMFQPHNNSGRILMSIGRYPEAVEAFERARALDPRHTVPLWNLWDLKLNRLNDPLGAEKHAQALAQLQPENGWIRHVVAWTDVALGRFEQAERGMREVLDTLPLHAYALPNLGHLLMHRDAAAEAAAVYRDLLAKARARQINVSTADTALFLGLALAADGRQPEARQAYEAEIDSLVPATAKVRNPYNLATLSSLYAAAGRRREAARVAAELLPKFAENPWILYTLARTHALLGELDAAADLLRRSRAAGYDQPYFVLVDPALRALKDHPVISEIAVRP
jgi:tetratricopeptide (TPR) repeat protein